MAIRNVCFFVIGILLITVIPVQAQEDWSFSMIVFAWGAGLDGKVEALGKSVEVDQSFGDILSNLEFGFSGGLHAEKDRWSVTSDFIYIGLGASPTTPGGRTVEVDVDQFLLGMDVGYEVAPKLEVLAGARIVSLQNKLQFRGPLGFETEDKKTWVDPVIGIRLTPRLSENISWWTRFDFGGFDVGSDFTWQINTNLVWQLSDQFAVTGGYRVLDMKYDDEEGDREFVYDATSHGPMFGLVYTF